MQLSHRQRKRWKAYIAELQRRDDCKCTHPVKVRTKAFSGENKDYHGFTTEPSKRKPYWLIEISTHLNYDQRIGYLIHEWAHCLDGHGHCRHQHSETWGVCYSIVYRAVEQVGEKMNPKTD